MTVLISFATAIIKLASSSKAWELAQTLPSTSKDLAPDLIYWSPFFYFPTTITKLPEPNHVFISFLTAIIKIASSSNLVRCLYSNEPHEPPMHGPVEWCWKDMEPLGTFGTRSKTHFVWWPWIFKLLRWLWLWPTFNFTNLLVAFTNKFHTLDIGHWTVDTLLAVI